MFPSIYKARITFLDGKKVGLDFLKPKPTQNEKTLFITHIKEIKQNQTQLSQARSDQ